MARGGRRVAQGGRPHELGRGGWLGCAVGRFAEALLLSQTPKCRRSPHVRRIAARRKVSRWRRSKKAPKEGGAGGDGNGIDALPDEVLQHVLSFPTAQEAVRTCVLARRWRHLWRSIPVLRVAAHGCLDQQGVNKLNKFVSYGSADVCGKEEFRGSCSTIWCHNCGTLSTDSYNIQCVLPKGLSESESLELVAEPGAVKAALSTHTAEKQMVLNHQEICPKLEFSLRSEDWHPNRSFCLITM